MLFGVSKFKFGKGSLIALTFLLALAAATMTSAVRPLNVFANTTSKDTCGYDPTSAPAPGGGTVVFNENTVTRAIAFYGTGLSGRVGVFANDESSLYIGHTGTTAFSPVSGQVYGEAVPPTFGSEVDESGVRKVAPQIFLTDITGNSSAVGGDWEQGGTAANAGNPPTASAIYGTWTNVTAHVQSFAKNNWNLGPHADTIPATDAFGGTTTSFNEGYGTEVAWNATTLKAYDPSTGTYKALLGGHNYRIQSMTHDGDQLHAGGDVGEVCTTVHFPAANLTITKIADAASVNAGDTVGFTVEIKNTGDKDTSDAVLADALPAGSGTGVTWAIDSSTGNPTKFALSGSKGSQTLGLASGVIPAGADYKVHITAATSATECSTYNNTATVSSTDSHPNPASASEGCNKPNVSITKTADAASVNAGDTVGFKVEIKNTGSGTAKGVSLADALPAGSGSGVTWAVDGSTGTPAQFVLSGSKGSQTLTLASSTLSAGADYIVHITAVTSASECSTYDNTATLSTTNAVNPNPASAEEVCKPAHVTITKTADASPVNAGDTVGFTVEVKNTGTGVAKGVSLSDALPAGSGTGVTWAVDGATGTPAQFVLSGSKGSQTLTLASSTLAAGADYVIHITASTSASECGVYDNTATLTTTNANNPSPASAEEVCKPANVTVTKTADAASVNAGDTIGFTVEVKNTGTGLAKGVSLSDALPGGSGSGVTWAVDGATGTPAKFVLAGSQGSQTLTLASSTLAAGADYVIHITASTSASECGVYDNTATLSTTNANNPSPASAEEVCKPAHVTITKTADASPVNAGDTVGFTVEVKNTGTGVAKGVGLADALPAGSGTGVTWAVDGATGTPAKFVLAGAKGSQTLTLASSTLAAGADYVIHITASTSASECGVYDNTATLTTTNANNPSPASAEEVCKPAHVTITKTADASPVNAGDTIGFTVEVKNTGTGVAKGVGLADALPAGSGTGVTWAVDGATGTPAQFVLSGSKGSQTLSLASSTLSAGADYIVHITATTSASECGVYDNTATLTTTNANNPNPASAEEVCGPAHVTITKTADASPVNAGDTVGFTVEVKNTGTGVAKGVSLADALPAGSGSGVTWAVDGSSGTPAKFVLAGAKGSQTLTLASSTLAAGADYVVHITASTSATECGIYDNTATLTTTNANNPSPASAEEVCKPAHVTITKTADASPVNAGDTVGFTVEVKNTGTGLAKGVSLSDALPGGSGSGVTWAVDGATGTPAKFVLAGSQGSQTLTLASSTLAAGADYTIHITASTSASECGVYDNTATLTTTNANNPSPASAEEVCNQAHVTITKTADASPVNAGDTVGFTVEVKNTGTGLAKGVTLSDALPAGSGTGVTWAVDGATGTPAKFVLSGSQGSQTLTLASSTLAAGADYIVHITASTSASECGVYDNTATLTTTNANNPSPASAEEVCKPAHVTITKTADASPVNAGDTVGFTVEVKNTGTGLAKGVTLSDALPGGSGTGVTWAVDGATGTPAKFVLAGAKGSQTLTLASSTLVAGADYVVHITASTSASECGVYDNTATLTTTNANNPSPASAEEVCKPAHVTITKTADASPVNAGDTIGFTVEVKNTGTGLAKGVSLSDALPGGSGSGVTWAVDGATGTPAKFVLAGSQGSQTLTLASSTLAAGADYTIHITATTSATECGVYDNTATLTTTNANNPNPASAEEVCGPAHVTITKIADASPVNAGDTIGFTVEVKNNGNGDAKGVVLSDPLPGGSGTGVTWAVDGATGTPAKFVLAGAKGSQTLTLASGTLAAGADYIVHITASTSASECGVYDNTATLTTTNANNPSPASAEEVCKPAHVTITKTADASPVNAGDTVGFTVEVKNTGTGLAKGVALSDALPGGSGSGVTWAVDGATGTPAKFVLAGSQGSQTLTLASSTLVAGADYIVHITATTSASECGVYDNTATLTTTNANNPDPASAEEVCKPAHVTITKTADASPVDAGDQIGFTVEVKNTGTGLAKGVSLSDALPAGSGSGVTWAVDGSTGTPAKFVLAGAKGSQTLALASSTLAAGADYIVHITASTSASECGVYDNTATLTTTNANNPDPASAEEVCGPAQVTITKTADASPVNAGDTVGFTVEVKNNGNGVAKGVTLSDPLPGGSGSGVTWAVDGATGTPAKFVLAGSQGSQTLTLASSTLAAGADYIVHITASTSATECGVYDNTATLTTTNANNPDPASAEEVCKPAHVTIKKTADASPVNAGDTVGFTVEVKNTGTGLAKGVSLSDALPGGSGSGVTWAVDGSTGTPAKFVLAGSQGSQTLSLASSTLAAGADYIVHITATTSATECGLYDNTATLTTTNANNPDPASAEEVCNPASIQIAKTADADTVNQGDDIGFKVTVYNTGTGNAKGVQLSDPLPTNPGLSWTIAGQGDGWSAPCVITSGTLNCGPAMVPGGTTEAASMFTVHITSTTGAGSGGLCPETGVVNNTASVTTMNDGQGEASAHTCIEGVTDLEITKTGSPETQNQNPPYQNITWTLVVTNNGPDVDTNVMVADPMPAGNTYVSHTIDPADGSCTGGAILNCSLGTMQVGASVTITLVTAPTITGQQVNTAQVVGDLPESDTTNNSATATVLISGPHIQPCTAVAVLPKQLHAGRKTKMHIKVTSDHKAVKGVRVKIKGPGISVTTSKSNAKGKITKTIKPKTAGVVTFRPIATDSAACKVPRVGIIGVFTPPVTG